LLGPAQFCARILEMTIGRKFHPIWTMLTGLTFIMLSISALAYGFTPTFLAVIGFGAGQGIFSIARGTLPLAVFGPQQYPVIMGKLGVPALFAQALAPVLSAVAIDIWGAYTVLGLMACLSAITVLATTLLIMSLNGQKT